VFGSGGGGVDPDSLINKTYCSILVIIIYMTNIDDKDILHHTDYCLKILNQAIDDGTILPILENCEIFYAIGQFDQNRLKKIIENSKNQEFWYEKGGWLNDWLLEDPHLIWYLLKIGCSQDSSMLQYLDEIKKDQTIEGKIFSNQKQHVGPLRVLCFFEPESIATKNAIKFFIENWCDFDVEELSVGILALSESNYYQYKELIDQICGYIQTKQRSEGCYCDDEIYNSKFVSLKFQQTTFAIIALSRFVGPENESIKQALEWLIANKENDYGVPFNIFTRTRQILLALIALGGGPKISLADYEWKQLLQKQKIDFMKPYFIHTSPVYQSKIQVKEIYQITNEILKNGKKQIRICSLFVDILYEELINLIENNPGLEVKLITRPSSQIKGMREKIARNVLFLLNTATKGNLRTNDFLHTRMIIIDDKEMIVSSADLTRDQLFDEFNAGIYTKDEESIKKAIVFFENVWEQSDKMSS
jgi:hypothetical protein